MHWIGCKTGVTETAGPCFSGFYENNETGEKYCVVVLSCKSMEARWHEVPKMVKWAIEAKQALKSSMIVAPIQKEIECEALNQPA